MLYVLDSDKTGMFTFDKIYSFYEFVVQHSKNIKDYELHHKVQSMCSRIMAKDLMKENGEEKVACWLIENLKLINKPCVWEYYPNFEYVHFDFIEPLYLLLNVKALNDLSLQDFFYLLQQEAEEKKLLSLKYAQLDDYIPLVVVRFFVKNFFHGYKKLYSDLGFQT